MAININNLVLKTVLINNDKIIHDTTGYGVSNINWLNFRQQFNNDIGLTWTNLLYEYVRYSRKRIYTIEHNLTQENPGGRFKINLSKLQNGLTNLDGTPFYSNTKSYHLNIICTIKVLTNNGLALNNYLNVSVCKSEGFIINGELIGFINASTTSVSYTETQLTPSNLEAFNTGWVKSTYTGSTFGYNFIKLPITYRTNNTYDMAFYLNTKILNITSQSTPVVSANNLIYYIPETNLNSVYKIKLEIRQI